jgi:four helix bundle protein
VAAEYLVVATALSARKMPRDLRDQFDRASASILFIIGDGGGAGKTAKADKQRSYEIARGSTTEAATLLDVLRIRGLITDEQYHRTRVLLIRVAQMLSRLCGGPVPRDPSSVPVPGPVNAPVPGPGPAPGLRRSQQSGAAGRASSQIRQGWHPV